MQASVVRPPLIQLAVIEAVAEVQEIEPIALVFLLSDSYQVIGEYPYLAASTSPQDHDGRDILNSVFEPEGEVFELESAQ